MTDVEIANHGSIVLVRPMTDAARAWLAENVSTEAIWFGGSLAVEPRYIEPLIEGMKNDDLVVA